MELSALQVEEVNFPDPNPLHIFNLNGLLQCLGQTPLPLEALAKPTSAITATDIIAERIKAKTRRFSRKSLIPVKKAQANRFAPVATNFLGPLLGGFQNPRSVP